MTKERKLYTANDAGVTKYYRDVLSYHKWMDQEDEHRWLSFCAFKKQMVSEHNGLVDESDIRCNRAAEVACILITSDDRILGVVFLHDPSKVQAAA